MKLIVSLYLIVMVLGLNFTYAQITFNNTYHNNIDNNFNILNDSGGYVNVLLSYNSTNTQYIFQKLDNQGLVLSSKIYGTSSDYYVIYSLLRTYDNNFAIGSYYLDLFSNKRYAYLAKLDLFGDTLWTKKFPAPAGFNYNGQYLIETNDKGFLITGQIVDSAVTNGNIFILKTDSLGNLEWANSFGGIRFEAGYSSVETPDGGFLTTGWTRSFGFGNNNNRDDIVVKWDSVGNYMWHQTYGTTNNETAIGISKTSDGNYVIGSGRYYLPSGPSQGKIIKIDDLGNVIWQKYQSTGIDSYFWVREMINTDLIGIGSRKVNGLDDGFLIRTDSSGNELWRRQYRFGNSHCYFRDVQETPDGGIICAGFVFKGASNTQDGWLVKLDSLGCLFTGCGEPTAVNEFPNSTTYSISVAPNPVISQSVIQVKGLSDKILSESFKLNVYDIQGKLVASPVTGFLIGEDWVQCQFSPIDMVSGLYLIEIATYSGQIMGRVKVVVQK